MVKQIVVALGLAAALAGCGVQPYGGPDSVMATGTDRGFLDKGPLVNGEAAIAYDPDGCQNWIIDDGIEGYSSPRYDPVSGLPVCNSKYPPGTVIGPYQTQSSRLRDWVPAN